MIPFNFQRSGRQYSKECAECGSSFITEYSHAKYCTPECARRRNYRVRAAHHSRCSNCGVDLRRKVVPL